MQIWTASAQRRLWCESYTPEREQGGESDGGQEVGGEPVLLWLVRDRTAVKYSREADVAFVCIFGEAARSSAPQAADIDLAALQRGKSLALCIGKEAKACWNVAH